MHNLFLTESLFPITSNEWHRLAREGVPADMRISDLFPKFLETLEGETVNVARRHLDHFKAFVGKDKKVSDLRPFHLTNYLKTKPGWKPGTVRTFVNKVHAAINWGVREGLLDKNPISSTPGYRRQGRFERRKGLITPEHLAVADENSKKDFRVFMTAMQETGARPSELRRARIEKVNLVSGWMLVPNKTGHQTGEKERKIYLSPIMKEMVADQIGNRTEGFVFVTHKGKAWTMDSLKKRWWRLQKKHGIKGSMYMARHAFASRAINQTNVNPALVAQLLGHQDLDMLLRHYLESDPTALQKAVEEINKKKDM